MRDTRGLRAVDVEWVPEPVERYVCETGMPRCDYDADCTVSASSSQSRILSTSTHGAEAHDRAHIPVNRGGAADLSQPLPWELIHAGRKGDNPAQRSRYSLVGCDDRGTDHRFHDLSDLEQSSRIGEIGRVVDRLFAAILVDYCRGRPTGNQLHRGGVRRLHRKRACSLHRTGTSGLVTMTSSSNSSSSR
jgi:hypothetical protein